MWKDSLGLQGYFKIDTYDLDGNLLDTFEEKNLIMDKGRNNLASYSAGFGGSPITKFVLGTQGHGLSLLDPKTALDGFVSSRTKLFSEDSTSYEYYISFVPTTNGGFATVTETNAGAGSKVKVSVATNLITYEIEVAGNAANNGGSVPYTEAGFYAGTNLFAMRCYPVRVKDISTRLVITWQFQF